MGSKGRMEVQGMEMRTDLLNQLEADRDQIIDLASKLVRIPTDNPPGDTVEIVKFLKSYLEQHGIQCHIIAPNERMPNLIAVAEGVEKGAHVVLNGHLGSIPRRGQGSLDRRSLQWPS